MKSAICSKCFAQAAGEQWVYSCRSSNCKMYGEVVDYSRIQTGRGGQSACSSCGEAFASPLCPECNFPIHEEDPGSSSLSVSFVGATGSGKSHFLSVLIEEFKQQVSKTFDGSLFPLGGDDTIELYDRNYYQPLYVRGQVLDSTEQEDVNPLIYSLVFEQERSTKVLGLTFYDACGANFESITAMANLNRSIYHSSGIIFLIDPSQLPVVGEWQAAHGDKAGETNVVALLSRTIQLIRTGSGQRSLKQKINVPIAVCITKLDTVKPLLDASSFLNAPSRNYGEPVFNKIDFEACNLEAQSLIEAWGGGEIVRQVTSQFSDYGFFAFSSLGNKPTDSGGIHHIAPHRVTDPLLWLMWRNKIIK